LDGDADLDLKEGGTLAQRKDKVYSWVIIFKLNDGISV
jgi:hypothetical protein